MNDIIYVNSTGDINKTTSSCLPLSAALSLHLCKHILRRNCTEILCCGVKIVISVGEEGKQRLDVTRGGNIDCEVRTY